MQPGFLVEELPQRDRPPAQIREIRLAAARGEEVRGVGPGQPRGVRCLGPVDRHPVAAEAEGLRPPALYCPASGRSFESGARAPLLVRPGVSSPSRDSTSPRAGCRPLRLPPSQRGLAFRSWRLRGGRDRRLAIRAGAPAGVRVGRDQFWPEAGFPLALPTVAGRLRRSGPDRGGCRGGSDRRRPPSCGCTADRG